MAEHHGLSPCFAGDEEAHPPGSLTSMRTEGSAGMGTSVKGENSSLP
jgi:hypothetical protein